MSPEVGVFWVYKDVVFGRARPVSEGQEGVKELVDSPDDHVTVWELPGIRSNFPELRCVEYQQVPRGRVLYSALEKAAVVYMDRTLHNVASKQLVVEFFSLHGSAVLWRTDPHYSTIEKDIDALLDE